jgi:hypothetical protein
VDLDVASVGERELERHRRRRGHQLEVVLALEALAHDVHVQQAEEAAAKAEAQRVGGLGLPRQRRVVERELLERVAQVRVVLAVEREQAAEHHRLDLAVAGQRLGRAVRAGGQRVADAQLRDVLEAGDEVADLARVSSSVLIIAGVKKPMSSMSASVPSAIARIASPFLNVPSTTGCRR